VAEVPPTYRPTDPAADVPPTQSPTQSPTAGVTPSPTEAAAWSAPANPHLSFDTDEYRAFVRGQWSERADNSAWIDDHYGVYCDKKKEDNMCVPMNATDGGIVDKSRDALLLGPTVSCAETGMPDMPCGRGDPWVNKTIWPLVRGPLCAEHDRERRGRFPLPDELRPYFDLGYDRSDPTKSADAPPFPLTPGRKTGLLHFDPDEMKAHLLKFQAMLEHYYEGIASSTLERQLVPDSGSEHYGPMVQANADQMARIILRAGRAEPSAGASMTIGVLGDSVTAGQDNCYYDAWPEVLRRTLSPIMGAMGVTLSVRNAGKNGGWNLASQMMCAHDMLGASTADGGSLDFLYQTNPFVSATGVDAEHMIRRAVLGDGAVVSIVNQKTDMVDLTPYFARGLTVAKVYGDSPPEMGTARDGHKYKFWFPARDRAFWGMLGDGFCHLTTRGGSSTVVNRNWHWGPKLHETYADAYALLLARATVKAIDDLAAGVSPPQVEVEAGDMPEIISKVESKDKPNWRDMLAKDMSNPDFVNRGLQGVRCAIGSANQPTSALLSDWLEDAAESPFAQLMASRNGVSYVPPGHREPGSGFYSVSSPISGPNVAVGKDEEGWVPAEQLEGFSPECPRTREQCLHADGKTMVNMNKGNLGDGSLDSRSWLVWRVPERTLMVGRAMMCHPRGAKKKLAEGDIESDRVRFHYAVPVRGANGEYGEDWKIREDVHRGMSIDYVNQECTPIVSLPSQHPVDTTDAVAGDRGAAWNGGMYVAVEWSLATVFEFDYLVAM